MKQYILGFVLICVLCVGIYFSVPLNTYSCETSDETYCKTFTRQTNITLTNNDEYVSGFYNNNNQTYICIFTDIELFDYADNDIIDAYYKTDDKTECKTDETVNNYQNNKSSYQRIILVIILCITLSTVLLICKNKQLIKTKLKLYFNTIDDTVFKVNKKDKCRTCNDITLNGDHLIICKETRNIMHKKCNKNNENNIYDLENESCVICIDNINNKKNLVVYKTCLHIMHIECYIQYNEKENKTCPLCKGDNMV